MQFSSIVVAAAAVAVTSVTAAPEPTPKAALDAICKAHSSVPACADATACASNPSCDAEQIVLTVCADSAAAAHEFCKLCHGDHCHFSPVGHDDHDDHDHTSTMAAPTTSTTASSTGRATPTGTPTQSPAAQALSALCTAHATVPACAEAPACAADPACKHEALVLTVCQDPAAASHATCKACHDDHCHFEEDHDHAPGAPISRAPPTMAAGGSLIAVAAGVVASFVTF
ncbi:hypothetical protein BC832DRAFT_551097 [Gaertneriomyces semiglobifer]|nr:hypothetical protein BC832DRAFT_551097 [Gaertneriomyces semiglobifer]